MDNVLGIISNFMERAGKEIYYCILVLRNIILKVSSYGRLKNPKKFFKKEIYLQCMLRQVLNLYF